MMRHHMEYPTGHPDWQEFRASWWQRVRHALRCPGGYGSCSNYDEPVQTAWCGWCGFVEFVRVDRAVVAHSVAWCPRKYKPAVEGTPVRLPEGTMLQRMAPALDEGDAMAACPSCGSQTGHAIGCAQGPPLPPLPPNRLEDV